MEIMQKRQAKQKNHEMTHIKKLSPDTGKVSAELTKGASWCRNERIVFTDQY